MSRSKARRRRALKSLRVLAVVDFGALVPGTSEFREGDPDRYAVEALYRIVRKVAVTAYDGIAELATAIKAARPDLVFNLTQAADGERQKDAHLCGLLELWNMPYTGATLRGLVLGRDKATSKMIAQREGFRAPEFLVVDSYSRVTTTNFPLVVKPRYGDASEGISQSSLVHGKAALLKRIEFLRNLGCGDIILEEFIDGREMVVPLVGDRLVPPKEFIINRKTRGYPRLASERFKYDKEYRGRWGIRVETAKLTDGQLKRLRAVAIRTARALEMRDYGRFDVRLTDEDEWVFLESNPNPGLSPYGRSFAGTWGGIEYELLIRKILRQVVARM